MRNFISFFVIRLFFRWRITYDRTEGWLSIEKLQKKSIKKWNGLQTKYYVIHVGIVLYYDCHLVFLSSIFVSLSIRGDKPNKLQVDWNNIRPNLLCYVALARFSHFLIHSLICNNVVVSTVVCIRVKMNVFSWEAHSPPLAFWGAFIIFITFHKWRLSGRRRSHILSVGDVAKLCRKHLACLVNIIYKWCMSPPNNRTELTENFLRRFFCSSFFATCLLYDSRKLSASKCVKASIELPIN